MSEIFFRPITVATDGPVMRDGSQADPELFGIIKIDFDEETQKALSTLQRRSTMNLPAITRRIRRCESEALAQLVLEYAIAKAVAAEREACADAVREWARLNDIPAAVSAADEIMRRTDEQRILSNRKGWTSCAKRMPIPAESPSGYFWCWSEKTPERPPEILEPYGYEDFHETPCIGFCHDGGGSVPEVTHWWPVYPPKAPA